MTRLEELPLMLRPAGGGVPLISTGRSEQLELQGRLYGASDEEEIRRRWLADLALVPSARAVVVGIPSDVGAGYRRGANLAPAAIRSRLLEEDPSSAGRARAAGVVDLGDVLVVPQLLDDEMLSEAQKTATRRAIYANVPEGERERLPVSPLSMAERVVSAVLSANPAVKVVAIGGDHSTAFPVVKALARARAGLGVVQVDAHTDLLEERFGIRLCYGTWSFHANELLGRGGRLVQIGTRASRMDRTHWESSLGVRQFWAEEVRRDPAAAIEAIVAHVRATAVERVYFSNDIDGTDSSFADATGTPEPHGLEPEFVVELVRRLGGDVGLVGGDVMEVAPGLGGTPAGGDRTIALAARYLRETIDAAVGPGVW